MVSYRRYRPVGWQRESYRHYLAAKGVSTRRYLVRNFLKGNRDAGAVKSLYAQGYNKDEAFSILGLGVPQKRARAPMIDVPDRDEVGLPEREMPVREEPMPLTPLLEEPVPVVGQERRGEEESETPGDVLMTPGVPPSPSVGFNIL